MKVTSLALLEKHLCEPSSASVYMIASPYGADRREIVSKIVSSLHVQDVQRFVGSAGYARVFQELQTVSLFATQRVIIVDEVDEWKEEESKFLVRWIAQGISKISLILGIATVKGLAPFLHSPAFILDLLQEKPWERQQRLLDDLRLLAREAKIAIHEEVFDFLLHQVGADWSLLKRELEKLLCYADGKKHLRLEEARQLIAAGAFPSGWTLAEQLIYQPQGVVTTPSLDTSALLALLGQLRYYLRLGHQLALGEEKGIKPYQVQKFKEKSRAKGRLFFEKGILALNEVESLLKSSPLNGDLLLHRFIITLHLSSCQLPRQGRTPSACY